MAGGGRQQLLLWVPASLRPTGPTGVGAAARDLWGSTRSVGRCEGCGAVRTPLPPPPAPPGSVSAPLRPELHAVPPLSSTAGSGKSSARGGSGEDTVGSATSGLCSGISASLRRSPPSLRKSPPAVRQSSSSLRKSSPCLRDSSVFFGYCTVLLRRRGLRGCGVDLWGTMGSCGSLWGVMGWLWGSMPSRWSTVGHYLVYTDP